MLRLYVDSGSVTNQLRSSIREAITMKEDYVSETLTDFTEEDLAKFMESYISGQEAYEYQKRCKDARNQF